MTPTKKMIAEVTELATINGVKLESALSCLKNCSLSIYKSIGAKGVVEAAKESMIMKEAEEKGGIAFSRCSVAGYSEKAYLLCIPIGVRTIEKWIAKSIIKDGVVPFWAIIK